MCEGIASFPFHWSNATTPAVMPSSGKVSLRRPRAATASSEVVANCRGTAMPNSTYRWIIVTAGGWIFDTTGNDDWLYIACFGMGIGAALIAKMFRPFPKLPEPVPLPA
jgi:hypothetical protein